MKSFFRCSKIKLFENRVFNKNLTYTDVSIFSVDASFGTLASVVVTDDWFSEIIVVVSSFIVVTFVSPSDVLTDFVVSSDTLFSTIWSSLDEITEVDSLVFVSWVTVVVDFVGTLTPLTVTDVPI